jgi:hypothetical protein
MSCVAGTPWSPRSCSPLLLLPRPRASRGEGAHVAVLLLCAPASALILHVFVVSLAASQWPVTFS